MQETDVEQSLVTNTTGGKKRSQKSCISCRRSKVRCDGLRPACSRCESLSKECAYVEKPKSEQELRIEHLEAENKYLKAHAAPQQPLERSPLNPQSLPVESSQHDLNTATDIVSPFSISSDQRLLPDRPEKRRRTHYRLKDLTIPDFVAENLIPRAVAERYFSTFFSGCDRFVPIFDHSDTFLSVRSRSSLLFNSICAIGCSVLPETGVESRMLNARLKRWLTTAILSPAAYSLETVQAFLVMACWTPERSLLLATAMNIAFNIGLDHSLDLLVGQPSDQPCNSGAFTLMRKARTWAQILNLEAIFQVDAGDSLDLKIKNVRRCRVLLDRPFSTSLDARLFSQLELNRLRTKINENIATSMDLDESIQEARVDLEIWFQDYKRIIATSPLSGPELASLLSNLTVQRQWAEGMAICRAIHTTGTCNIDLMTPNQKALLTMARKALQTHLDLVLEGIYLKGLTYAMDFVWAKNIFAVLLLLKLSILLGNSENDQLVNKGRTLQQALTESIGHKSEKVFLLQLLRASLDAYVGRDHEGSLELESLVPEQFTNDWNFPGLELFSSPAGWDLFFDQTQFGDGFFLGLDVS